MPLQKLRSDREIARERAETARSTSDAIVYSDASGLEDHLGVAVVALDANLEVVGSEQIQVGPMDRWSVRSGAYWHLLRHQYGVQIGSPALKWRVRTSNDGDNSM